MSHKLFMHVILISMVIFDKSVGKISESHCLALSRASMITAFQLSSTQVLNESQLVERSQIPTN